MQHRSHALILACALAAAGAAAASRSVHARPAGPPVADTVAAIRPPALRREFRAAWVATVANIDWPTKRGLPVSTQKEQMIAILDRAKRLNLNAIILQVRPCCDAIYPSKLEPWTEYLSGAMGRAPEPYYDPLATWIEEAHKRGLELHAWFNPYRAHHPSETSPICEQHVSRCDPGIVRRYGKHLWLDPGEKATQDYSLTVVMDVVNRYNIDGVHLDDYFYPYREKDAAGNEIDFPDDDSYRSYVRAGGNLSRADWRRDNVDRFVARLYHEVKASKPWVKVGISPFGIWRPGHPSQIRGFDAYQQIYADSKRWLNEGWVDYWSPQLYWPVGQTAQSFPVLLRWWERENTHDRCLWPGSYTSRVHGGGWQAVEVLRQIEATREQRGASGNVHFSMEALMHDADGLDEKLERGPYAQPALVPACPWLDQSRPAAPEVEVRHAGDRLDVYWRSAQRSRVAQWIVQERIGGAWRSEIVPGTADGVRLPASQAEAVAVSVVDRCGVQSEPAVVRRWE